jgi:hypothetical protein
MRVFDDDGVLIGNSGNSTEAFPAIVMNPIISRAATGGTYRLLRTVSLLGVYPVEIGALRAGPA